MLIQVLESVTKVMEHEVLCGDGLHQVQQVDAHGRDLRLGIDPDAWCVVQGQGMRLCMHRHSFTCDEPHIPQATLLWRSGLGDTVEFGGGPYCIVDTGGPVSC